jgi:hypothetical protein
MQEGHIDKGLSNDIGCRASLDSRGKHRWDRYWGLCETRYCGLLDSVSFGDFIQGELGPRFKLITIFQ